jgi:hypothetical protein
MPDDDFKDFLVALSAAGVRYLVVGAYAMASHGLVRATGDLDTWIEPTLDNAERLSVAIREFADTSLAFFGVSVEELAERTAGFYMGVEPDRIDVHTTLAGVTFEQAWNGRISGQSFGVQTEVLGLDDLIAAKRAAITLRPAGSSKALQDAADLAWLEAERSRRLKLADTS